MIKNVSILKLNFCHFQEELGLGRTKSWKLRRTWSKRLYWNLGTSSNRRIVPAICKSYLLITRNHLPKVIFNQGRVRRKLSLDAGGAVCVDKNQFIRADSRFEVLYDKLERKIVGFEVTWFYNSRISPCKTIQKPIQLMNTKYNTKDSSSTSV